VTPTVTGDAGPPATDALFDSSAAIPLLTADHAFHGPVIRAVHGLRLGLSGHAWFETYSVLTRLPGPNRRSPSLALAVIEREFPGSVFLLPNEADRLRHELARLQVSGGAVFDALVAAAARAHGLPLYSCDRRAERTYRLLGVNTRFVATGR
jgi:predicted nucleic acid-binding protein